MRRFLLKLHVKLCIFCGKFNKQVMESQEMCRCFKEREEDMLSLRPKLDESKKNELKQLLYTQSQEK